MIKKVTDKFLVDHNIDLSNISFLLRDESGIFSEDDKYIIGMVFNDMISVNKQTYKMIRKSIRHEIKYFTSYNNELKTIDIISIGDEFNNNKKIFKESFDMNEFKWMEI